MTAFRPINHNSLVRKLKLSQLMVFEQVLEKRSILRAANEIQLTQSAVTRIIHELEALLEGPLFERSNRGVTPTEMGLLLGLRVRSLMAEVRYMGDDLNNLRLGSRGRVVVGTVISASASLLPEAITLLKERYPDVLVTIHNSTTSQLFPALATGELDIVVGRLPEQELPLARAFPLSHRVLFHERLCVVAGRRYADYFGLFTSLHELNDHPWILPPASSPLRDRVEKLFFQQNLPMPRDIVESLSVVANLGMMQRAPRLSFLPKGAAVQFFDSGLIDILNIPETGDFGAIGFSLLAGKKPSVVCGSLIDCLQQPALSLVSSKINSLVEDK
ncbi:LysR family transcriptional regulator [Serratia liquefaciens]